MMIEIALALLFGLIFGSFANVVIYRLPKGESIVFPGSHCPSCKTAIPWFLNVPVLSWIFLKGRCAKCRAAISFRYPLVELLTGILFSVIVAQYGVTWLTLEYLIFTFGLIVVSFIDFDHMILPDKFTLPGIGIGLIGAWLNPERSFAESLIGVVAGGGFLWAVAYIYLAIRREEGMGGGDIKLLAWIGAVLGWTAIPFTILFSSLFGSLIGLAIAARKKEGLKSSLPFGPYLAVGAILYMLGGETIARWYIALFLPSLLPPN